jgi:hypothetical protein
VIVRCSIGNNKGETGNDKREPCKASEHGYVPFVVPARHSVKSRTTLLGSRISPVADANSARGIVDELRFSGRSAALAANQPLDLEV